MVIVQPGRQQATHPWVGALSAWLLLAAAVGAAPPPHPAKLIVNYADLDLTRAVAIAELYHRVERAARLVCLPATSADIGAEPSAACVNDALSRAVMEINEPALTRYAAEQRVRRTPRRAR